ncbi:MULTISPECIES: hypothetical protein [Flavobacteriaceae]|nr:MULTISPECIES: hypothetical protein [Allomuricauda]MDC6366675.1 hypothetical protein [Muricauda sp. AC10]
MRTFILTLIFAVSLCSISCSKEDIAEQEELVTVASGTGTTTSPKSGRD